ncbi:hypothetical protein PHMEG_0008660 [Phytophthora megakarya]|uniref:Uncharacterized protein n=1 Tax=Phytophthora megakarya TaxID=4795 RepID=A0A225WJU7_9STRA|nr:hypothetical protein PHMEG_0008660 [Phytophthora megakarya]
MSGGLPGISGGLPGMSGRLPGMSGGGLSDLTKMMPGMGGTGTGTGTSGGLSGMSGLSGLSNMMPGMGSGGLSSFSNMIPGMNGGGTSGGLSGLSKMLPGAGSTGTGAYGPGTVHAPGTSATGTGVEFVVQPRLAIDRPLFHIDTTEAILGELSSNLSRMYLETCMVMAPLSSDPSVGSCFQTKLRGGYEMTIETTSYTPLVCNVTDAGKLLWLHVTDESNGDTFDFNSVHSPLYVIALATYQKYEAENQVVLVGSVRWLVPAERLEFEDQYWTIIEPSPIDSGHSSVVRTLYRLRSKDAEGGFTLQQQATRGTLIKSISNITRRYLQSMQNAFLDSTMLC